MRKSRIRKSLMIDLLVVYVLCLTILAGCAALEDFVKTTKGALVGNSYTVYQYDNTGNQTLVFKGSSIEISPYQPKYNESGEKELTSVLDITVDGHQVLAVGNTLIFEEKGLSKLAGYEEISEFANSWSAEGLHFIPYDKLINSLKNFAGKPRLIFVYSQLGEPLAVYQGDSVYVSVPSDLPKMTRLNIDGHSLYLHRVNYTIIDMALMN